MILALGIGFGVQALTGYEQAPWWGLLAGLLVAPLIPGKASCGIRRPGAGTGAGTGDGAGAS